MNGKDLEVRTACILNAIYFENFLLYAYTIALDKLHKYEGWTVKFTVDFFCLCPNTCNIPVIKNQKHQQIEPAWCF